MNKEIFASLLMGLASVLLLFAGSYYASERLISGLSNSLMTLSPSWIIPNAFEESLASGAAVEKIVSVTNDVIMLDTEVIRKFAFQRDYYENEFAPNLSISITFECHTAACEARGPRAVRFVNDAFLRSQTTCVKTASSANCKITFYDATEKSVEGVELALKPKNSLQRELFAAFEPEVKRIAGETGELKRKNPLEKAALFWTGTPQNVVSSVITLAARLGIIMDLTSKENHFFQAQQKYGLKYPDGSGTPKEFISHVKQTTAGKTSGYPSTQVIAAAYASKLGSESGLLASGMAKLLVYSTSFPTHSLVLQLDAIARNDFPEYSLLYSFPESESIEEQVHRALSVYALDRNSKKGGFDAFPVISAENQIIWLNKTNNTNASERINFIEGAKTDFSQLEKYIGPSGVSLGEEVAGQQIFELNGLTLTAKKRFSAFLKTMRECAADGTCMYAIQITTQR